MDNFEVDLLLLKERSENFKDQLMRFVSHLESEQRVTGNISKRVDEANYLIKTVDELVKKHEKLLLNEGRGLAYRIDRIENALLHRKSSGTVWMNIISLAISLGALILMFFK